MESKAVLDSRIPGTRFRIPVVSGILDSLNSIPDSKPQDSGFRKQKFPWFPLHGAKSKTLSFFSK